MIKVQKVCINCAIEFEDIPLNYKYANGWECPECKTFNFTVYDDSPIPLPAYKRLPKAIENELLKEQYKGMLEVRTGLKKQKEFDTCVCKATIEEYALLYPLWEKGANNDRHEWKRVIPAMQEKTAALLRAYRNRYRNGLTWSRFLVTIRKDKDIHPSFNVWNI